ncbi:hypothetical protein [Mycobacterium dioxanotrophicus]|uniref:hypothetical protein n=1 Tax=Mycobacterium dioxanotrophicus TaxID=482462 RepID=UPI0012FC0BF7|nr:hypothetical protein [Mycobacterium dioxanotrophicus]
MDTLAVIEHGAARGFWRGADEVLAVKQLAERQTQALNAVRELCGDLIAQGRGHGAAPTRSDVIAAAVAESILTLIEAAGA